MENPTCIKCVCNWLGRWRLFCTGAPYVSLDLLLCLWVITLKSFIVWETIKNGSNGKSNEYKMCMQLTRTVASVLRRCSIRLLRSIPVTDELRCIAPAAPFWLTLVCTVYTVDTMRTYAYCVYYVYCVHYTKVCNGAVLGDSRITWTYGDCRWV